MMSHLHFTPNPSGSGFLFNSATCEVMTPTGAILGDLYWDYPSVPTPPGVMKAFNAVSSCLKKYSECVVTVLVDLECIYIHVVNDSPEGDPGRRDIRIPAGAILADITHTKETVFSQLGWQA